MRLSGIAVALGLAACAVAASGQTPRPSHSGGSHTPPPAHTAAPYHPSYRTLPPSGPTYHTFAPTYRTLAPTYHHTMPPSHQYHSVAPTYRTLAPTYHPVTPSYHHTSPSSSSGGSHTTRTMYGSVHMRSSSWVRGLSSYHQSRYHVSINITFAQHPYHYPNAHWSYYNGHRWWDGYWHYYWIDQDWMWWNGEYGFWLDYDGIDVFVYEYSPGLCRFWDGYEWAPWYDPPWTPYYCPY